MNIEAVNPGPTRLIRAIIDELQIIGTINNRVQWDVKQWKLSPGELIAALIIAFFSSRVPLYKVWYFYRDQDLELLFGRPDLVATDFTDDSLGRALDRLEMSEFTKIYGSILINAKKQYDLRTRCCHADTTSLVVYGEYDDPEQELVDYGFSKENRFDLKQIKSGICASSEGIPIYGEPINGNKDDKTWNKELLEKFKTTILTEFQSILVCDSQLITKENLASIDKHDIQFISRLPNTYKLAEDLKKQAWSKDAWQDVGVLSSTKNAASYRIQEFKDEFDDQTYRFIVIHSSKLDRRKEESLRKRIDQEKEMLVKSLTELSKIEFACRPDAENAWPTWLKKNPVKFHRISKCIVEDTVQERRAKRGRPRLNDPQPPSHTIYRLNVQIDGEDPEAIQVAYDLARTFILIANVPDLPAEEILRDYKDQYKVEQKFGFLKDPYYVGPLFMKKQERLIALHHVLLLTLLVYSLFQLRMRRKLKEENEPINVGGSYYTFTPKAKSVLDFIKNFLVLRIHTPTGIQRQLPSNTVDIACRVIGLAGFDVDIYTTPPIPPSPD